MPLLGSVGPTAPTRRAAPRRRRFLRQRIAEPDKVACTTLHHHLELPRRLQILRDHGGINLSDAAVVDTLCGITCERPEILQPPAANFARK